MKISIVVPIYNVEKYLDRCVKSLLSQTYSNIEILLIDDGSPDNCPKICDEYAKIDDRIKVIHKANGGVSLARNIGIENATGEYILFVDSDDYLNDFAVEKMVGAMQENDVELVVSSYVIDYQAENYSVPCQFDKNMVFSQDQLDKAIFEMEQISFYVLWNKLYKASIIKDNNIRFSLNAMPGEDLLFNCEYLNCEPNGVALIKDITIHYMRYKEHGLASKYRQDLLEKIQYFNQKRKELYQRFDMLKNKEYLKTYAMSYLFYAFNCIPNLYKKAGRLKRKQRKIELKKILNLQDLGQYLKLIEKKDRNIRLLGVLYKLRKTFLPIMITDTLFYIRYTFENFYKKRRKKMMQRRAWL